MVWISGPKNASARDSAAMRWPSRQITASEIAGAFGRAAMARARSASTSPSAPSATCASVSGCAGLQQCGGRFSHGAWLRWNSRMRRNSAVSNSGGAVCAPLTQVKIAGRGPRASARTRRVRRRSISRCGRRRSGRAPDPSRGCRDARSGTAGAAGAGPALRSKSAFRSCVCSNAKNPDGAGRWFI